MDQPMTDQLEPEDSFTVEQRRIDRRKTTIHSFIGSCIFHRRREHRRGGDSLNNYIDWYGPWPLVATLLILLMCFADAFLTLILLENGAVELNIFMDWLIKRDVYTFTVAKMLITGLALFILVMHFNFRVYKLITVRYLMYALVPLYSLLIAYEINMLMSI